MTIDKNIYEDREEIIDELENIDLNTIVHSMMLYIQELTDKVDILSSILLSKQIITKKEASALIRKKLDIKLTKQEQTKIQNRLKNVFSKNVQDNTPYYVG